MAIGDNIKRIRELRKMSVQQLADKMGKGKQNIYNWESGDTEPELESIKLLSKALDVPINELTGENPTSVDKPSDNNGKAAAPEEVYRNLVESNSEYRLVPKVIFDNYEIVPKSELREKAEIVKIALKAKDDVINQLNKEIAELRAAKAVPAQPQHA